MINNGSITAKATATTGNNATERATAIATGVQQNLTVHGKGNVGADFVSNNGSITAFASAKASGHGANVNAKAMAIGVYQGLHTSSADTDAHIHA